MSAVELINSLLKRIKAHEPVCNLSVDQTLPYERELSLLFHQLKTRNLYRLNIEHIHSKLETILNQIPIYTRHSLLNKYYAHSWISHVSHKVYLTPLAIFVTLLKKYVIRKKFHVLWNIIVLLLKHGANPLLHPLQTNGNKILSLSLIWSIYCNLFIFIDDEQHILNKVSFALSFVDQFECNTLSIHDTQSIPRYFNITSYHPSICGDALDSHIPSPLFLSILLQFSFPIFHNSLSNNHILYHLSFVGYHEILFNHKLMDFISIYDILEKKHEYPLLTNGICTIIIGMMYGDNMMKDWKKRDNDGYYLYHLFGLNNDWMQWSFIHIWRHKTHNELKDIVDVLSSNNMYLDDWSGRVRESSCYYTADFVKFYIKIIEFQQRLNGKEIALWMRKYEDNAEILQLLFKQKYIVNKAFVNGALYGYFWSVIREKDGNCMVLRLLNKHLVEKSVHSNGFEYIYLALFRDFCDKYSASNWRIKHNLKMNMIELLQQLKLNGLDIINTRFGIECIFNGASCLIFKGLTERNLFNIKEIENNNETIDVIFDIFRIRGKYIQSRHKNIMIEIGKWLIHHGKKEKLTHFVEVFTVESQQIYNQALKHKQITMIEHFKKEWGLH